MATIQNSLLLVLSSAVLGAALGAGCSGNKPADPQPPPNPTWNTAPPPPTSATTTVTAPPPPPPTSSTAPPPPPPTASATAVPVDLTPLLKTHADKHAKGAKPEGQPLAAMLQQGQTMQMNVTLAPSGSKCYTAIALGAPSITELTVELWANPPPPLPPTIVSQSQAPANPAVMAGSPNCFKNLLPLPGPGILKVTAKAGSGPAVVQLYAK